MPFISSSDGASIHYDIRGSGPVDLVFLHGWGGDTTTWGDVFKHLDARSGRFICIDLRGHGKSGAPDTGYTIDRFGEDIMAVAESEGAKKLIVVGFSMGGKLGCYLAAKYPGCFASLILIAPAAPDIAPVDRASALQAIRQARDWRQYEAVFKNWFAPGTSDGIVEACCQTMARTRVPVLEATAELFLWTSLANDIGRLEQPSLLIAGEKDPIYGIAYQQREMLPFLNRATVETLPSGHFVPVEQPVELAATILKFAKRISTGCSRQD